MGRRGDWRNETNNAFRVDIFESSKINTSNDSSIEDLGEAAFMEFEDKDTAHPIEVGREGLILIVAGVLLLIGVIGYLLVFFANPYVLG